MINTKKKMEATLIVKSESMNRTHLLSYDVVYAVLFFCAVTAMTEIL